MEEPTSLFYGVRCAACIIPRLETAPCSEGISACPEMADSTASYYGYQALPRSRSPTKVKTPEIRLGSQATCESEFALAEFSRTGLRSSFLSGRTVVKWARQSEFWPEKRRIKNRIVVRVVDRASFWTGSPPELAFCCRTENPLGRSTKPRSQLTIRSCRNGAGGTARSKRKVPFDRPIPYCLEERCVISHDCSICGGPRSTQNTAQARSSLLLSSGLFDFPEIRGLHRSILHQSICPFARPDISADSGVSATACSRLRP